MGFENTLIELERKRLNIDQAITAIRLVMTEENQVGQGGSRIYNKRMEQQDPGPRRRSVEPAAMERRKQAMRDAWARRKAAQNELRGQDPEGLLPQERQAENIAGVQTPEPQPVQEGTNLQFQQPQQPQEYQEERRPRAKGRAFKVETTH